MRSEYGKVPLSLILDINLSKASSFEPVEGEPEQVYPHLNNDGFMAVSFQSDRPLALKKFQEFLDHQLPHNVFRAKGILWFSESPKQHLFQLSGKRFTVNDREWKTTKNNQIVFIGRNLDAFFLTQSLNNCLTR